MSGGGGRSNGKAGRSRLRRAIRALGGWPLLRPVGVGIAVALSLALAGLANHYKQSGDYDGRAQQHAADALQVVGDAAVPPVAALQAPPANPEPDREEWRSEQDLQAQRDMAYWAMVVAIASGLSVVVTAFGVWYVRQTLEATRATVGDVAKTAEEAVEANRIMREDRRPWVDIEFNGIEDFRWTPRSVAMVRLKVENVGKTPVGSGRFFVELHAGTGRTSIDHLIDEFRARYQKGLVSGLGIKLMPGRPQENVETAIFDHSAFDDDGAISKEARHALGIVIFFGYQDISKTNTYYTAKNFILIAKAGKALISDDGITRSGHTFLLRSDSTSIYT